MSKEKKRSREALVLESYRKAVLDVEPLANAALAWFDEGIDKDAWAARVILEAGKYARRMRRGMKRAVNSLPFPGSG